MTRVVFKLALLGCAIFVSLVGARAVKRGRLEAAREEAALRLRAPRPGTRPLGFDTAHGPTGTAGTTAGTAGLNTAGLPTAGPATPPPPRPPRGKLVSLVYGSNRQGEIEPCG